MKKKLFGNFFKITERDKKLIYAFFIIILCLFLWRPDVFFATYFLCVKGDLISIDRFGNTTICLYKYGDVEISEKEIDKILNAVNNSYYNFSFYIGHFPNHEFYFNASKHSSPEKFCITIMDANQYFKAFGDSYGCYSRLNKRAVIRWDRYCDNFEFFWIESTVKHETFHHLIDIYQVKTEELMAEDFENAI